MSLKEKFKSMMGIEYDGYEEEDEFEDYLQEEVEEPILEPPVLKTESPKPVLKTVPSQKDLGIFTSVNKEKGVVLPMNKEEAAFQLESHMNKVIIREPNEYSDAQDIADCLKENFPVFINLQRLEKAQAKRVVDFLSGTIYAIDGDIKRVGTNLFLCTPKNVETEGQVSLQELQMDAVE